MLYIRRTLIETKEAVRAADETVVATREIRQDQLRPWLVPQDIRVYITQNSTIDAVTHDAVQVAQVIWTNSGQSPAVDCQIHAHKKIVPRGAKFDDFIFEEAPGVGVIGQSMTATSPEAFVPPSVFDKFKSMDVDFIIGSRATYAHSLNPTETSLCDVAYRISMNGARIGKNGKYEPNYAITLEYSRVG